ncbi:hypothetical protein, partial [Flavobacterium muglaense]|uniref:hypothetical protein n=1 Tax=Flavobacterium muglaense TaxID=2764716 RepID=UPI001C9A9965
KTKFYFINFITQTCHTIFVTLKESQNKLLTIAETLSAGQTLGKLIVEYYCQLFLRKENNHKIVTLKESLRKLLTIAKTLSA